MIFHPRVRHFGNLEVLEVYEYYDRPLLLSCRNATGSVFLAVLSDDMESAEVWLLVAMTEERFKAVRSGIIDLHTAFRAPEEGIIHEVTIPRDSQMPVAVAPLSAAELIDAMLPALGARIELPTATLPHFEGSLTEEAIRSRRDLLRLEFDLPAIFRSEAPAKFLGNVLTSVQDAVSAIAQALEGSAGRRGALSRRAQAATELAVVGVGGGSFEVKLASFGSANLLGRTDATAAIEEFVRLLEIGSQADPLQERLARLQARAAANYLKFLRSLDEKVDYARAEWASPAPHASPVTVQVSAVTVRAAIAILEYRTFESREEIDIVGRLIGANINKMTFEIWIGQKKSERYSGFIAEEARNSVEGAILGERYKAHLERTESVRITTGEVVEELELLALQPLIEPEAGPEAATPEPQPDTGTSSPNAERQREIKT